MGAALGQVDTESGPPSAIPLQHFIVGLVFLIAGTVAGIVATFRPTYALAHVHLLLVGWVCVTIMGAMTQFVPVWSDVSLHSRRLAKGALILVAVGVMGLATVFATESYTVAVAPGAVLLAGLWTFVYNLGRTLPALNPRRLDVTETHFLYALVFFLVTTAFGVVLAADYRWRLLAETPFGRGSVVAAHAVFAVFGIVVTTVLGAMYQLVTMFTQTEMHQAEVYVSRFERITYPTGVVALAFGRLFAHGIAASVGAVLILVSLVSFAVVALRKLYESRVDVVEHPMLVRYVVALVALLTWVAVAAPVWTADPVGSGVAGDATVGHVLFAGFVGYVVVGTLYHIFPFLIWVESYSDRLGLEDVPMIDDLYDRRLERTDLVLTPAGIAGVVAGLWLGNGTVTAASGAVALIGYTVFVVNVILVVERHKPGGLAGVVSVSATGKDEVAD